MYVDADVLAIFRTKLTWVKDNIGTGDSEKMCPCIYTSICLL